MTPISDTCIMDLRQKAREIMLYPLPRNRPNTWPTWSAGHQYKLHLIPSVMAVRWSD